MPTSAPVLPESQDHTPRCFALVPCAGTGSRAGAGDPKQYRRVAGQRLVDHALNALLAVPELTGIGVVLSPDDPGWPGADARLRIWRVGGASRAHSVFNGLEAWLAAGASEHDWVLVHDAARCLLTPVLVQTLIAACGHDPVGGLLAVPVPDTLKRADPQQRVSGTLDRSQVWSAQTPQMFRLGVLRQALLPHVAGGFQGITDEASAIELAGLKPLLVRSSVHNFKVTFPEDFALAEALLLARPCST